MIGSFAVLLAAFVMFGTGRGWPDAVVALTMGRLAIQGGWRVMHHALGELREARA